MTASARWLFLLLALFCASAWAEPNAEAAREQSQPGNNQPFWLDAQAGRVGITNAQNIDAGVLINTGGELWRRLHEGPFPFWGAIWLAGVPAAILAFWLVFGPIRLHGAESGRMVRRFAAWERALHWTVAICFILLALTGFTLFFGKYYVEALLTYPVYSWVAKVAVSLHNFTAPVFTVAMVSLFLAFVKRNLWRAYDWQWLRRFGGFLGGGEPPSGFFNAGEKIWFWFGVTALGLIMVCSGAVLLLPVYNQTRDVLAVADIVHLSGALLFVGMAFGHIYIGTLGMRGAYRSMREGVVDETWAKEHHSSWYQDLKAGRVGEASDAPLIPSARPVVWRQTD
ncbi:MAG: formate dehydrogenase subunit gamma [Chloroflexi bacterium]|nr:MAG: formate dehydrogenase subunit gamma [Chloroflexota bacterium]